MGKDRGHRFARFQKILALSLIVVIGLPLGAFTVGAAENERTLVDQAGRRVTLPAKVNRIVVPLPWMLNIVTAVGARDKVVGVSSFAARDVGFNALFPEWVKSRTVVGELDQLNKEAVLQVKPDLAILQPGVAVKQMEEIGIPAVVVAREVDIPENIRFIGKVLAQEKEAEELASFYERTIAMAAGRTADIPESARKRVYFTSGPDALKVAGKGLGNAPIIRKAGGILVSENLPGGAGTSVSMEQALQWDPDIIVVGYGFALKPTDILADPKWQGIKAVRGRNVYLEPPPHAACLKKHPSAALGALWLAQKAYPERFRDIDVQKLAEDFILKFYGVAWKADFK